MLVLNKCNPKYKYAILCNGLMEESKLLIEWYVLINFLLNSIIDTWILHWWGNSVLVHARTPTPTKLTLSYVISLGCYKAHIIPLVISSLFLLQFNKIFTGSFPGKVFWCPWKSSWTTKSWFSLAIWSRKDFVSFIFAVF